MQNEWILNVLADLRRFADLNELPLLSDQLEDAIHVALGELSLKEGAMGEGTRVDARADRALAGQAAESQNA